jgi:hypothetical protein
MKVVLISGATPAPAALRDLVVRGSTALLERTTGDVTEADGSDADRIVFWAGGADAAVGEIAERCARHTDRRADRLVFVAEAGGPVPAQLSPHERFEWPADEDRLRMAFETGA